MLAPVSWPILRFDRRALAALNAHPSAPGSAHRRLRLADEHGAAAAGRLRLLDEHPSAEPEDVDRAVMHGPGLRWALMGPYLTYHLGGGAGAADFGNGTNVGMKKKVR